MIGFSCIFLYYVLLIRAAHTALMIVLLSDEIPHLVNYVRLMKSATTYRWTPMHLGRYYVLGGSSMKRSGSLGIPWPGPASDFRVPDRYGIAFGTHLHPMFPVTCIYATA